jgi:hypothetical protein
MGGTSASAGTGGAGGVGAGGAAGVTGGAGGSGPGGATGGVGGIGGRGGAGGGSAAAAGGPGGASGATAGAMGAAGGSGGLAWQGTRVLGTTTTDYLAAMVVDGTGNLFISGTTGAALYGQTAGMSNDMFALKLDAGGALQWAAQIASDGDEAGGDMAVDAAGNVYISGSTNPSIDGGAGAGGFDVVLAKFDSTGARQWIRQFGSAGNDYGAAVVTDAAGNVYVAGTAGDALPGNTSAGHDDTFLVKFDGNGTQQWAHQFGTATSEDVTGAAIDAAGNIYVAGYETDPDNAPPNAPETPHGFLAKYDAAGTPQWTRAIASSGGAEKVNAVAVDGAANVYVAGYTSGDFGGSGNAGYYDAYVLKYDGAGNRVWGRQLGTAAVETADAVTTDTAGNVYVGGGTSDPLTAGVSVGFVAKYGSNGAPAWARQTPMNTNDVSAVGVDPRGDVFIAGSCSKSVDGQPALAGGDIFVMKYSADGVKY